MTFKKLIEVVAGALPDAMIHRAADALPGESSEGVPVGDALAEFIVSEIYYSFDEKKSDRDQLVAAWHVVTHGKGTLETLGKALWRAADEAAWQS